jgi:hypothetical protein
MIQDKVKEAFDKSQTTVPIRTGQLKASGSTNILADGAELKYSKDYASFVERGFRGGTIHVEAYTKKNGTHVRAYSYYSPPRTPRKFIETPMTESFKTAGEAFDRNLRNHFRIVIKK